MNHFKTERKAIYDTATFFTECGWIFREQPIVDLGIDAQVETPIDENGQIKIFGLQIKGGESNFRRKKKYLTFYFSIRHHLYWNAISENYPLFIILQDALTEKTYWQHYTSYNVSKTPKNWKLDIPYDNVLNEDSKEEIVNILYGYQRSNIASAFNSNQIVCQKDKHELTICYCLNTETNTNMQICLKYKNEKTLIDLGYKSKKKEWDFEKSFLSWENAYYYSIIGFERYLRTQFDTKNKGKELFKKLVNEVNTIGKGQVENIAEFMFNYNNNENDVPKYAEFLKAFELHSKLKKGQYEAQALDSIIHFKAKNKTFEMSTYESLTESLKPI